MQTLIFKDYDCTVYPLDNVTNSVSEKYFGKSLNIQHGITLGVKHLFEAKEVILIANSKKKAEIIKQVVEGKISNKVPASLFQKLPHCKLCIDEEAASHLSDKYRLYQ